MRMNTKIKHSLIGRKTELTYYDVTNYYFETMYGDEDELELDEDENPVLDDQGKPMVIKKGLRKKGVCLFTKIPEELKLIYQSLGIDYDLARPTVDELNKLKKRIVRATIM